MRARRAIATAVPVVLGALLLTGCGGGDATADPAQDAAEPDTTEQAQDDTDEPADEDADAASEEGTDTADASGPVDVCALFTADDFATVFGVAPSAPGESVQAQGSLLGGCSYMGPGGQFAMIQARPAGEWDGTVEMYGGAPAAGASMDTSFEAEVGLLAAFDGQAWFGHIMCSLDPGVWDEATSVAVAEAMASHL